mgnify:CR=1 FL=1
MSELRARINSSVASSETRDNNFENADQQENAKKSQIKLTPM